MTESTQPDTLAALSARHEISNLIARYGISCDDRDIVTLAGLFTEDAFFGSADETRGATGRRQIFDYFKGRFEVMGPSYHWSHDRLIEPLPDGRAKGTILGHVEFSVDGQVYVGGLRYHDQYRHTEEGWKFARRAYASLYLLPAEKYATSFASDKRVWAYGNWYDADIPEKLDTWHSWRDASF